MDAEHYLGKSERQATIVKTDAVPTRECEFETAAQREALDHSDCGTGQGFQGVEHHLPAAYQRTRRVEVRERGEFLDVGASHETASLSRAQDQTSRRRVLQ